MYKTNSVGGCDFDGPECVKFAHPSFWRSLHWLWWWCMTWLNKIVSIVLIIDIFAGLFPTSWLGFGGSLQRHSDGHIKGRSKAIEFVTVDIRLMLILEQRGFGLLLARKLGCRDLG